MADENPNSNIPKSQLEVLRKISIQLAALNANQAKLIDLTTDRLNQETGVVTDRLRAASMPNGAPAILAPGARQPTRPAWTERYSPAIEALDKRMTNQPPGQTHPGASRAPNASPRTPERTVATPTEVGFRRRLAAAFKGDGGLLDRADTFLTQPRPQDSGRVGPNASLPHPIVPGMTQGQVADSLAEQIDVPRFGEWQLNDKLALARDAALRIATNRPDGSTSGRVMGTVAGALNYAHANAANMVAAGLLYRGLHSKGKELMSVGTDLGYSPNDPAGPLPGIIPGLGDRNPLDYITSSAGQQALGLKWDAFKLARGGAAGVDKQQADEIYAAVAAQGYSNQRSGFLGMTTGGNAQDIANNFVAPLVAGGNGSPEDIAQYATFLRNGSVNLGQFADTLSRVAGAAKGASETTAEYNASLVAFIEQSNTQFGSTANQAAQTATAYTAATGLDPSVLGQSQNNPMFQGLALGRYGVMPSALGALAPGLSTANQVAQAQMLSRAFAGLNHDQYTTMPNGQRIVSVPGQDAVDGAVAHAMGISVAQLRVLTKSTTSPGAEATTYIGSPTVKGSFEQQALDANTNPADRIGMTKNLHSAIADLKKAGVKPADINNILAKDSKDPEKMGNDLVKLLQTVNHPAKTDGKVAYVKFTGLANKFFTQDLSKIDPGLQAQIAANAGGTSLSQSAANPISPGRWLSDLNKGLSDPSAIGADAIGLAKSIVGW